MFLPPVVDGGPSLRGRRVLVLRPEAQADDLARALEGLGATPLVVPAIRIEPLSDWSAVDRVLDRVADRTGSYDWVLFTSVNGVASVTGRMAERGLGPDVLRAGGGRVGAIGPATRRALEQAGIAVDWVPSRFTTQALAAELPPVAARSEESGAGTVCVFRADVAGPELDDALVARGFEVERVDAYRTIPAGGGRIAAALASGVDALAFTSASIVRAFVEACSEENLDRSRRLTPRGHWEEGSDEKLEAGSEKSPEGSLGENPEDASGARGRRPPLVCCIGPATAQACTAAGLRVDCEATEHTIPGLVRAIAGRLDRLPPAAGAG